MTSAANLPGSIRSISVTLVLFALFASVLGGYTYVGCYKLYDGATNTCLPPFQNSTCGGDTYDNYGTGPNNHTIEECSVFCSNVKTGLFAFATNECYCQETASAKGTVGPNSNCDSSYFEPGQGTTMTQRSYNYWIKTYQANNDTATAAPSTTTPSTVGPSTSSAPVTNSPATNAPVTSSPYTTDSPVTSSPFTNAPATSSSFTTNSPATNAPVTSSPYTADLPVTSSPVTGQPRPCKRNPSNPHHCAGPNNFDGVANPAHQSNPNNQANPSHNSNPVHQSNPSHDSHPNNANHANNKSGPNNFDGKSNISGVNNKAGSAVTH